jgi:uncharacterized protein (TIGR02301 family)
MTRAAALLLALVACTTIPTSACAQSFFERLFRPAPQPPQPLPPQYRPPAQTQPQAPRRTAPAPAPGQQRPGQQAQPAAPAPVPEPPPAPYEPELLRMAEIIGSLAFLRSLCAEPDAVEWPQRMQSLLEAEGTSPGRRERLAGAYNKGFRGYALTYRACTASASEATSRFLREGDQLARNLSGRYGG